MKRTRLGVINIDHFLLVKFFISNVEIIGLVIAKTRPI